MIELSNPTPYEVPIDFLISILKSLTKKKVELLVVDKQEMRHINATQRNIDKPTDVLSFPYNDIPLLGSIVICIDFVKEKANELGHTQNDEFALLFIHALLHLLGYDHENDNGEMRKEEARLIAKFNLPKSLIVRTQG